MIKRKGFLTTFWCKYVVRFQNNVKTQVTRRKNLIATIALLFTNRNIVYCKNDFTILIETDNKYREVVVPQLVVFIDRLAEQAPPGLPHGLDDGAFRAEQLVPCWRKICIFCILSCDYKHGQSLATYKPLVVLGHVGGRVLRNS